MALRVAVLLEAKAFIWSELSELAWDTLILGIWLVPKFAKVSD